ncbi:MAG: stage II sporulation protein P [Eubacteriales bacterium]|nr:stage II sporulation protein P [Eubacteriales bacterium]
MSGNKLRAALLGLLLAALLPAQAALAEETDGGSVYTMVDEHGRAIARRAGRMYVGDGLIRADDREYVVVAVDDEHCIAYAEEAHGALEAAAMPVLAQEDGAGREKLICLYCTHSDESYEPTDGEYSKEKDAGIYDVSEAFAESLQELGVRVERSEETFLPHDSGAYRRSRATAAEFAKQTPAAIFDIHRDGIPDPTEYEETVDGDKIAQVRLLVGRSNENAEVNKSFAKQIKAAADEKYPGLIRDIFIGKGNYNQELYPRALLLEFGTYSNDKELVLKSTDMMADAVHVALFSAGEEPAPQRAQAEQETNAAAMKGVAWVVGVALAGGLLWALVSTGTLRNLGKKISSGASEISGGLFGKKHGDNDGK